MDGDNYGSSRDGGRSRDNYYSSRHDRDRGGRDDRRDRDRDRRDRDGDRRERRRSRSPHHPRGPRRDYDDSYSSSRRHQEREREERYSSRRDDRDWRRERPDRRGDERRRDRDLFDDRRGGGGGPSGGGGGGSGGGGPRNDRGAREDRDEFAAQARGRGASPQPKKREPTPDLTGVISVLERKRRLTQWDIKPPGYESVTAEQAKLSGMFPLPGAPRQQMDPSRLQAFINQPQGGADSAALKTSNARQSKRLFASNIPATATDASLLAFVNLQLNGLNVTKSADPCVSANISADRTFALLEFKSPGDATVALAMSGITMEEHHTEANGSANGVVKGLELRRPKDYIVPAADADVPMDGDVSSDVPDTENKIAVTNIPTGLDETQVTELLGAFGPLKAFVLVKDVGTGESRGIAFVEYVSAEATPIAVEGLNEVDFEGVKLHATLASIGFKQASGLEMGVNAMSMFAGTTSDNFEETRVLQLLNMVTAEELIDNDEYEEICEDIREECQKYGTIVEMKIPRPAGGSRQSNGVGKIYIKYSDASEAKKALQSLAGRKFADRTVVTSYFDESSFDVSAW